MKAILILVVLLVSCGVVNEAPKDMSIVDSAMLSKDGYATISDMPTLPVLGRLRPLSTKYVTPDNTYTLPNVGQFYDTGLMFECALGIAEDGIQRCIPISGRFTVNFYYSDSACTQIVAQALCGQPYFSYASSFNGMCGIGGFSASSVYKLGSKITTSIFYKSGGTCSLATSGPYDYYQVLNKLLPTDMVAVQTSSVW